MGLGVIISNHKNENVTVTRKSSKSTITLLPNHRGACDESRYGEH